MRRASQAVRWRLVCTRCAFGMLCGLISSLLPAQGVRVKFSPVSQLTVVQRLQRLPLQNAAREAELRKMFEQAGCPAALISEQLVRPKDPPNIICTLPGSTDSSIIVAGHLDHADEGTGAVDDWSGASLLSSLYETLKGNPRRHTFIFIGFTDEEKNLAGSGYYVRHSPVAQLKSIRAMVNLECLGLRSTGVWAHHADKELLHDLAAVAAAMQLKLVALNMDYVGIDDADNFRDRSIPTITIHSLEPDEIFKIHSKKDNLHAVNVDNLYESYRVVAEYLAYIDAVLK